MYEKCHVGVSGRINGDWMSVPGSEQRVLYAISRHEPLSLPVIVGIMTGETGEIYM